MRHARGADEQHRVADHRQNLMPDPILEHRLVSRLAEHASQDDEQVHDPGERGRAADVRGVFQSGPGSAEDRRKEQYRDEVDHVRRPERVDRVRTTREGGFLDQRDDDEHQAGKAARRGANDDVEAFTLRQNGVCRWFHESTHLEGQ